MPGPKVATLTSGAGTASEAQTQQNEGLRPAGCMDENANWCGVEVPSYSDEAGCWASGENCWKQLDTCYDTAPPTGSKGCEIWQRKCQSINDACEARNFNGPPNKGKDLTPKAETVDVGLIMQTSGGGVDNSAPKTSAAAAAKSSTPAASKPKSSAAAATSPAAAPKPSSAVPKPSSAAPAVPSYGWYEEGADAAETPKHTTITVPASEAAPAPTAAPSCPEGWHCVTKYATEVVTEIVYVTVDPESYGRKRSGLQHRRHGHSF